MKPKEEEDNARKGHNTSKRYNFDRIIDDKSLKQENKAIVDVLQGAKDNKETGQVDIEEHQDEIFPIVKAHTVHNPRTVMVHI